GPRARLRARRYSAPRGPLLRGFPPLRPLAPRLDCRGALVDRHLDRFQRPRLALRLDLAGDRLPLRDRPRPLRARLAPGTVRCPPRAGRRDRAAARLPRLRPRRAPLAPGFLAALRRRV